MSDSPNETDPLKDLFDDYLDGRLDEARTRELEERLRAGAGARDEFVRYARLHTDLHLEARARQAGDRALRSIARLAQDPAAGVAPQGRSLWRWIVFRNFARSSSDMVSWPSTKVSI